MNEKVNKADDFKTKKRNSPEHQWKKKSGQPHCQVIENVNKSSTFYGHNKCGIIEMSSILYTHTHTHINFAAL